MYKQAFKHGLSNFLPEIRMLVLKDHHLQDSRLVGPFNKEIENALEMF